MRKLGLQGADAVSFLPGDLPRSKPTRCDLTCFHGPKGGPYPAPMKNGSLRRDGLRCGRLNISKNKGIDVSTDIERQLEMAKQVASHLLAHPSGYRVGPMGSSYDSDGMIRCLIVLHKDGVPKGVFHSIAALIEAIEEPVLQKELKTYLL